MTAAPEVRAVQGGFSLVEVLVAVVILAVGLLAVAGISSGVASLTHRSTVETEQTVAAQQMLEKMVSDTFGHYPRGAGAIADTTLTVAGHDYTVTREVFSVSDRVDSLRVIVEGKGRFGPDTFRSRMYQTLDAPTEP